MKRVSISLLLLFALGQVALAQSKQPSERERIVSYLRGYLAEFNNRPASLQNEFGGEFVPLPDEVGRSLQATFPHHRFTAAKTRFYHYSNQYSANIILITDAASGEVVAHLWELWFSGRSESFYQFLTKYPAASREDALYKVKVLASLMVGDRKNDKVGKVALEGQTITAEFLSWGKPYRILKVEIGEDMKFGRITMINPTLNEVDN